MYTVLVRRHHDEKNDCFDGVVHTVPYVLLSSGVSKGTGEQQQTLKKVLPQNFWFELTRTEHSQRRRVSGSLNDDVCTGGYINPDAPPSTAPKTWASMGLKGCCVINAKRVSIGMGLHVKNARPLLLACALAY